MSIESMIKLIEHLLEAKVASAHFSGPKSEEEIREAERRLGAVFPKSYREFLLRCGRGGVGGVEFDGIGKDGPTAWGSVVFLTEADRRDGGLPKELITVYEDGYGSSFVIDTSQARGDEAPIIAWTCGMDESLQSREPVYPDFASCFVALVREELDNDDEDSEVV